MFWPDHQPFAAATEFTGQRLIGHQQVTDAYLLGLALKQGGVLATLDERIASLTTPKTAGTKGARDYRVVRVATRRSHAKPQAASP